MAGVAYTTTTTVRHTDGTSTTTSTASSHAPAAPGGGGGGARMGQRVMPKHDMDAVIARLAPKALQAEIKTYCDEVRASGRVGARARGARGGCLPRSATLPRWASCRVRAVVRIYALRSRALYATLRRSWTIV